MKYREEQRYNDSLVYIILVLVGALVFTRIMRGIQGEVLDIQSVAGAVVFVLLSVLIVWYLRQLRFTVRMNDKNLKIGYNLFHLGRRKIKWKHVRDIALIRLPKYFNWSGMNVHFSGDYTHYDLGGQGLLRLVLNDGEVVCVGVKRYKEVEQALSKIDNVHEHVTFDEVS